MTSPPLPSNNSSTFASPYYSSATVGNAYNNNSNNATLQRQYQRQLRRNYYQNYYNIYNRNNRTSVIFSNYWKHPKIRGNAKRLLVLISLCTVLGTILWGGFSSQKTTNGIQTTTSNDTTTSRSSSSSSSSITKSKNNNNHISPAIVISKATSADTQHDFFPTAEPQTYREEDDKETSRNMVKEEDQAFTTRPKALRRDRHNDDAATRPKIRAITAADKSYQTRGTMADDILPLWLSSYIAFHRRHVVPVISRRGANHYQWKEGSASTYYLTYHCNGVTCGGLGDRLQGIVQAFYMALCTDRVFLVDWRRRRGRPSSSESIPVDDTDDDTNNSNSPALTDYLLPNLLKWYVDDPAMSSTTEEMTSTVQLKFIQAMDNRNDTYLIEPLTLPHSTHIRIDTNLWMEDVYIKSQCWQNYQNRFLSRTAADTTGVTAQFLYQQAFTALFDWSPAVVQAARALRQRAQLMSEPHHRVAMHIRTGKLDTGRHRQRHADPDQWMQFVSCAHTLRDGLLDKQRQISCPDHMKKQNNHIELYLAADHVSVKKALLKEDSSIKTVLDLDIYHLDDLENDEMANGRGEMAAWSELYVLRESTCLVMSHSKYSQVAADLSPYHCVVYFDDCGNEAVQTALASVVFCPDQQPGLLAG